MMNNEKKILLTVFVISLLTLAVALFLRTKQQTLPSAQKLPNISPTPGAYIHLKAQDSRIVFKPGEAITVEIYANSRNTPISGYDANIIYNSEQFKYAQLTNLNSSFDTVASDVVDNTTFNQKKVALTGSLKLQEKNGPILSDTLLASLTFTPLKGTTQQNWVDFGVEFKKDSKKDSNLIDVKSQDILTGVNDLKLIYGEVITLYKGKPVKIGDLKLTLTEVSLPDEQCNDCITSAKVEVQSHDLNSTEMLNFQSGGFAGLIELSKPVFNRQIEVERIEKDRVIVRIGKLGQG